MDSRPIDNVSFRKVFPLRSIVTIVFLVSLFLAVVFGLVNQFYASFLFYFYSWTGKMWVSVIMLGVFQTLILIPFRIIRLAKSVVIEEFKGRMESADESSRGHSTFKEYLWTGNRAFLFYLLDFSVQLVSFVSLGRLFLTDFYNNMISKDWLYSFVPYPDYPIRETIFKVPYFVPTETIDMGWSYVLMSWGVLFLMHIAVMVVKFVYSQRILGQEDNSNSVRKMLDYWTGNFFLMALVIYFLLRYFPLGFEMKIFSGDVAMPNQRLNTITAIATFLTVVWFGMSKIKRQVSVARSEGVDMVIVGRAQMSMFKDMMKNSILLGVGAYFITNQIPSAFELSVFTLELISLASPMTIDRLILGAIDRGSSKSGSW